MKTLLQKLMAALGIVVIASALTSIASAECANLDQYKSSLLHRQSWSLNAFTQPSLVLADDDDAGIVGFWKVDFTSKGTTGIPDGAPIDNAFSEWHSDGTEIMNSSKPPITSSFCLGVWKRVSGSRYKLNHYAIGYNPDNSLLGVANIRENVTLASDGKTFTGTFSIDQYDQSGNLLMHVQGLLHGTRITVDTVINKL